MPFYRPFSGESFNYTPVSSLLLLFSPFFQDIFSPSLRLILSKVMSGVFPPVPVLSPGSKARETIAMHGAAHFVRWMREVGRASDIYRLESRACCKLEHMFRLPSSSLTPLPPLCFPLLIASSYVTASGRERGTAGWLAGYLAKPTQEFRDVATGRTFSVLRPL